MLVAAFASTLITALLSVVMLPLSLVISHAETLVAAIIATVVFTALTAHAWGKKPPLEGVAWIFGHLTIWAFAYALYQLGWLVAEIKGPGAFETAYLNQVLPFLKAIQASALAGLIVFAWYYSKGIEGKRLSFRMRSSWTACMIGSSLLIILQSVSI